MYLCAGVIYILAVYNWFMCLKFVSFPRVRLLSAVLLMSHVSPHTYSGQRSWLVLPSCTSCSAASSSSSSPPSSSSSPRLSPPPPPRSEARIDPAGRRNKLLWSISAASSRLKELLPPPSPALPSLVCRTVPPPPPPRTSLCSGRRTFETRRSLTLLSPGAPFRQEAVGASTEKTLRAGLEEECGAACCRPAGVQLEKFVFVLQSKHGLTGSTERSRTEAQYWSKST